MRSGNVHNCAVMINADGWNILLFFLFDLFGQARILYIFNFLFLIKLHSNTLFFMATIDDPHDHYVFLQFLCNHPPGNLKYQPINLGHYLHW